MARWRERSYATTSADVNLTPLIDVVFIVLIMFIIIAPLMERERVTIPPSSTATTTRLEQSDITVTVDKKGGVALNGRELPFEQLGSALAALRRDYPQTVPMLLHDPEATFGTYQSVKRTLERAGFEQLDVIVRQE